MFRVSCGYRSTPKRELRFFAGTVVKPIDELLRERFSVAIATAFGPENSFDPLIKTADPRHADYQSNVAMPLAKRVGGSPRDVAQKIVAALAIEDLCEPPVIAGPGFINLRLKKD